MRRSRNEVGRWRMARQTNRRKIRWLEAQSRRYTHIRLIRHQLAKQQRRSLLFKLSESSCQAKHYF
ncbi:YciY family protein [Tatumella morbirosei]|uniref:YciY family protein n=1 Tax=Tatumella morbirosei TaxID=642227 RepID=UPI0009081FB3|nr:YciY family protein [Tatumella morbirosei]